MTRRNVGWLIVVLTGVSVVGIGFGWSRLGVAAGPVNAAEPADKPQAAEAADRPKAPDDKDGTADREAVRAAVKDFIKVFEKGDAKALAALWTEEGEYVADDGATLRGRAAIEDGYAQFFKKNPDVKLDLTIESIRFVSHDSAVVEGSARSYKGGKAEEPTSSRISALYARENGQWLLALLREWPDEGAALRDVDWLIGTLGGQERQRSTSARPTSGTRARASSAPTSRSRKRTRTRSSPARSSSARTREPACCTRGCSRATAASARPSGPGTASSGAWTRPASSRTAARSTATNLLTPLDKDSFTWQSIDRTRERRRRARTSRPSRSSA